MWRHLHLHNTTVRPPPIMRGKRDKGEVACSSNLVTGEEGRTGGQGGGGCRRGWVHDKRFLGRRPQTREAPSRNWTCIVRSVSGLRSSSHAGVVVVSIVESVDGWSASLVLHARDFCTCGCKGWLVPALR